MKASAVITSVMLASSAMAAVPAMAQAEEAGAQAQAQAAQQQAGQAGVADTRAIVAADFVGTFSYNQGSVSPIQYIREVFNRAAGLCSGVANAQVRLAADGTLYVTGPAGTFGATVEELMEDENVASYLLACACSSNLAGGGAVANGLVEGVTVESVAQVAGTF